MDEGGQQRPEQAEGGEADPERIDRKRACCQRAPKSPQLWAFKIPWPAGSVRIGDQPAV
ncbi:hypothetical protein [Methylorubrum extorquens]|uniref:hypothetical protein n=1 Tax=Methylorubrum extorquens TaxID=408 RepID=UPI0020A00D7E|nr:hypothetical protein [Methylorubrum extorquens]MCP1546729.1 hypothetical protein [Methylorubrum extorquens]MCP1591933.1 hypothetical protein [Methylorubrum extorquens]